MELHLRLGLRAEPVPLSAQVPGTKQEPALSCGILELCASSCNYALCPQARQSGDMHCPSPAVPNLPQDSTTPPMEVPDNVTSLLSILQALSPLQNKSTLPKPSVTCPLPEWPDFPLLCTRHYPLCCATEQPVQMPSPFPSSLYRSWFLCPESGPALTAASRWYCPQGQIYLSPGSLPISHKRPTSSFSLCDCEPSLS